MKIQLEGQTESRYAESHSLIVEIDDTNIVKFTITGNSSEIEITKDELKKLLTLI